MSRKTAGAFFRPGFKRVFQSSEGREVFPRAMAGELRGQDMLPFVSLADDDRTVVLRGNELMQCIRIGGLNSMTASDDDIDSMKSRLAEIVAQAGSGFSFYIHKISRPFKIDLAPVQDQETFAAALDTRWRSVLSKRGLRDRTLTISVISRPSAMERGLRGADLLRSLLGKARGDVDLARYVDQREARRSALTDLIGIVVAAFSAQGARVLSGSTGELIGFLEGIGCGLELPSYPSPEIEVLARSVCNYRATFRGKTIHITGGRQNDRVGRIFAIKNYPQATYAGMFDELNLPLDMVITHSFVPVTADVANERMRRELHQKRSTGDAARTQQDQLEAGRDRVTSGVEVLGHHHMTVAIYAESEDVLAVAGSEIRTVAQETGTTMVSEAFPGPGHYYAQWPGNAAYRSRSGMISNRSFASMASLHRTPTGFGSNEVPWETPITVLPTPEKSGVHFSFHPRGKKASEAEPPAGHSLIFGPTGGGKTVLIAFLMAQAQRCGARVFAFDYRRGLEWQIRALGGVYTAISPEQATGLNPLYAETDAVGRAWLSDWLAALLRRGDHPYTPLQTQALHQAVTQNAEAPATLRNWVEFGSLFRSLDDDQDMVSRVQEWAPGGRYGWVFGDNGSDNFALDRSVMGFDLTAVLDSDQEKERTAILGYLFQRLERKLQDRHPTIIIIDEAWKALATTYFADKLQNWLVTARKLNAVVLMVTQFPSQLQAAGGVGSSMLQAVQSQIVLCNDRAKAANYDLLNLNDRELSTVLSSSPGSRLALVRNEAGSVVVNLDFADLGGCLTVLGGGETVRKAIGADFSTDSEAWRKLL